MILVDQESVAMVNKHYPHQFKADAVALFRSRPGATIASIADDLGVNRESCVAGSGPTTSDAVPARRVRRGRRRPPPVRPRTRTRSCVAGSGNWRKNATFCVRRPGISPGRRAGEPLPVRRRPPHTLRREAVVPDPRASPVEFTTTGGPPRRSGPPATPRIRPWPPRSGRSTPAPTAPTAHPGSPPSCATPASR
jgi:hypothetical protein